MLSIYTGMAKEYYIANPSGGMMYKIVPETINSSYTNVITCFAIPGSKDAPVTVQQVLPDLSQYRVSHHHAITVYYCTELSIPLAHVLIA